MSISRRDFLNGVALTIAAGLTPAAQIAARPARYPPALTGLRGQHDGSFETAHAQARAAGRWPLDGLPVAERYDLIVVGGGISGLAAAFFYRRVTGASARILVLDNHDDFGGHAKRNEFMLDGRLVIGYGGSESIDSPAARYSDVAKGLLRDLAVEVARFETAFERTLYPSLGLARGLFFAREAFGRDVLVVGEPPMRGADELTRRLAKPLADFVAAFPVSPASKAQLIDLYDEPSRRSSRSSRPPAIATILSGSAAAARRRRIAFRAARSASSGSAATRCRRRRRAGLAIRASAASRCRSSRTRRCGSPTSTTSPTATPRSRASWCARSSRRWRPAAPWTTW
jgi:NAD(P)-binding Rossmann-like domain